MEPKIDTKYDSNFLNPQMLNRSSSYRQSELSRRHSQNQLLPGRTTRVSSLPNSQPNDSEEVIRQFTLTNKGLKNMGDSRRRSIRKSSILTSPSADHEENNEIEVETVHLDTGEVKEVFVYQVIIAGMTNSGKHSTLRQFKTSDYQGVYSFNNQAEVETDNILPIVLEGEETRIHFTVMNVDMVSTKYPKADAYVLVYDVTQRKSFEIAVNIARHLKRIPIIFVGNKSDLVRKRVVTKEDARAVAKRFGAKFIETSAAVNDNFDKLLAGIVRQIKLHKDGKVFTVQAKPYWLFSCFRRNHTISDVENLFT